MDKEKLVLEEEESENHNDTLSEIVEAIVEHSFQKQNDKVAEAAEKPAKQVAAKPEEQPVRFRKAMPPRVLRDLTLRDPKRARRIIANRMSAARAKEKKKMHIQMLENQLQNLRSECNATLAQVAFVDNESQELMDESSRLKERVTMILRRISLQDELNEQIRKEVQYLKTKIESSGLNDKNAKPDKGTQP